LRGRAISVLVVILAASLLASDPARAGSVWDPNEQGHRLDIRWVGVYELTGGRIRVTITFYDKVRLRWFGERNDPSLGVRFTDNPDLPANFFLGFFLNAHHRLMAQECESGSACTDSVPVSRPNAITLRTWIGFPDQRGPRSGWPFRAISVGPRRLLDKTAWGVVS
jgi:hypothetical protein